MKNTRPPTPGPRAGKGRPKGSLNKTTATLKEAILKAAELSGRDGKGKDGLVGYLRRVADDEPKAFAGLLGRVLPLQVTGENGGPMVFHITGHDAAL
jgi:hypothetical protein